MKKYTDKELKAMTSEEREALLKQSTDEFDQLGKQIECKCYYIFEPFSWKMTANI